MHFSCSWCNTFELVVVALLFLSWPRPRLAAGPMATRCWPTTAFWPPEGAALFRPEGALRPQGSGSYTHSRTPPATHHSHRRTRKNPEENHCTSLESRYSLVHYLILILTSWVSVLCFMVYEPSRSFLLCLESIHLSRRLWLFPDLRWQRGRLEPCPMSLEVASPYPNPRDHGQGWAGRNPSVKKDETSLTAGKKTHNFSQPRSGMVMQNCRSKEKKE